MVGVGLGNLGKPIVVENHLVGPSPLILPIVAVDFLEAVDDGLNGLERTVLDIVNQAGLLALGQQKSGEVDPVALAYFRGGHSEVAMFLGALQDGSHV